MKSLKTIFEVVKNRSRFKVYCDMDGVLVDFENGLVDYVNNFLAKVNIDSLSPKFSRLVEAAVFELGGDIRSRLIPKMKFKDFKKREPGRNKIRKLSYSLVTHDDIGFWEGLDWMPDGKQLWNYIKKLDPTILSSPISKSRGKASWAQKHLGLPSNKVILEKDKFKYAEEGSLLIDDMEKNTVPFEEHGGTSILHKNALNTIRELKSLGL